MRIVTFNVYWLQGSTFAATDPDGPRPDVLAGIGPLVADLAPDLLCVQELQSFAAARELARAVGLPWWLYRPGRSAQRPQYGGGSFVHDPAWGFTPVEADPIQRFALKAVRADGLCVANVHLRSDRFEPDAATTAAAQRAELLAVLESEPAPEVLAGDFNAPRGADLYRVLGDRGYVDALDRVGRGGDLTTIGKGTGDRIWVHGDLASRIVAGAAVSRSATRMSDAEHLSDHLPVWAELDL
ncbi:MAG: hypothetical protein BIFFINMI_02234 [Phycisphaerae bacterium]|nr:hypothetical protein [Phycisphaerae bacterium]